ncbi:uncharacterized protein BDR25DRAFT_363525, partial [Lindgomyces ingoldianus]
LLSRTVYSQPRALSSSSDLTIHSFNPLCLDLTTFSCKTICRTCLTRYHTHSAQSSIELPRPYNTLVQSTLFRSQYPVDSLPYDPFSAHARQSLIWVAVLGILIACGCDATPNSCKRETKTVCGSHAWLSRMVLTIVACFLTMVSLPHISVLPQASQKPMGLRTEYGFINMIYNYSRNFIVSAVKFATLWKQEIVTTCGSSGRDSRSVDQRWAGFFTSPRLALKGVDTPVVVDSMLEQLLVLGVHDTNELSGDFLAETSAPGNELAYPAQRHTSQARSWTIPALKPQLRGGYPSLPVSMSNLSSWIVTKELSLKIVPTCQTKDGIRRIKLSYKKKWKVHCNGPYEVCTGLCELLWLLRGARKWLLLSDVRVFLSTSNIVTPCRPRTTLSLCPITATGGGTIRPARLANGENLAPPCRADTGAIKYSIIVLCIRPHATLEHPWYQNTAPIIPVADNTIFPDTHSKTCRLPSGTQSNDIVDLAKTDTHFLQGPVVVFLVLFATYLSERISFSVNIRFFPCAKVSPFILSPTFSCASLPCLHHLPQWHPFDPLPTSLSFPKPAIPRKVIRHSRFIMNLLEADYCRSMADDMWKEPHHTNRNPNLRIPSWGAKDLSDGEQQPQNDEFNNA